MVVGYIVATLKKKQQINKHQALIRQTYYQNTGKK